MTDKLLILNGPNLNLLGEREPQHYGRETLADIAALCNARAAGLGLEVSFRQSNAEATLVEWIHGATPEHKGIIINGGAFSHTSVAILDALRAVGLPVIEVHLSNVYRRESFRHHSYISGAAIGVISGLRGMGYGLAIEAMAEILKEGPSQGPKGEETVQ